MQFSFYYWNQLKKIDSVIRGKKYLRIYLQEFKSSEN